MPWKGHTLTTACSGETKFRPGCGVALIREDVDTGEGNRIRYKYYLSSRVIKGICGSQQQRHSLLHSLNFFRYIPFNL
jgi:hypothetical protein